MKKIRELTWEELENSYPPSDFLFKTTDELQCLDDVIGQEKAKKAMEFGLSVNAQGYNIYMSGEPGAGKTTFAKIYAQKAANQKPIPRDWCYVYNFRDKRVPTALSFEPGEGKKFRDDMTELIEYITQEIPHMYTEESHLEEKNTMVEAYEKEKELRIDQLQEYAKDLGFLARTSRGGISFIPLDEEGAPLSEERFESFPPEQQEKIENDSIKLQQMARQVIEILEKLEVKGLQEIENLEYHMALKNIGYYIKMLKEKYGKDNKVKEYLEDLQQDILDNIKIFIKEEEKDPVMSMLPWIKEKDSKILVNKYNVNLLVDHSKSTTAPMIMGNNTTYNKILGQLEYANEFGTLSTDYMKIKPGLFHQANGGYLILKVEEVLGNNQVWNTIKHILKTGKLSIENPQEMSVMTVGTLKPEPIHVDVKVICLGDARLYHLLYENDPEFRKLFKVRADFNKEMHNNEENTRLIAQFIKTYCQEESLLPFSRGAMKAVVRYASRYVESQKKITTEFGWISSIIVEAHTVAILENAKMTDAKHVHLAVEEKRLRASNYEDQLNEHIMGNKIMIETKGSQIGQINGLAVYDAGEYRFGKPVKITATTYQGKAGIVNIEKEAKLSGSTHTKGIQVITGYLGKTYAQDAPLTLSCRICFEQNYGEIHGDSASSAELYAVLSSLAEVDLKQSIAVTGSVNQHGMIQAVGGATYKIEGFFEICKKRGLTGNQGVIIPIQNTSDLVLNQDVMEAIKKKQFHIYPVSTIEEGLEILCDQPYSVIQKKVTYKLEKFNLK